MSRTSSLVIDNFTLQDVGDTLRGGLTEDDRVELRSSSNAAGYEAIKVPSVGVQIETLLQLLNVIILSDDLIVEAAGTETWGEPDNFLQQLRSERIVAAKPFTEAREEWLPLRHQLEEALCFSPRLAADFADFRSNWKPGIEHPVFSTLLWGTAGMIARSQFLRKPYLSHPSRGRLISLGVCGSSNQSAHDIFNRFISTKRIKLFDRLHAGQTTRSANLSLPPLALEAIRECDDLENLISTAVQLRDKYAPLREWIATYQDALDAGPVLAAKEMALLEAAASDVDRLFRGKWWARMSLDISFSLNALPQVSAGISVPIGAVIQRNKPRSIRTAVTKLIHAPEGVETIEKLLEFLGGTSPGLRAKALNHLS